MKHQEIPKGYITQKEIQAAQRYYKIGRMVMVHTYKAQGIGSLGTQERCTAERLRSIISALRWCGCRAVFWIACYGRI